MHDVVVTKQIVLLCTFGTVLLIVLCTLIV